MASPAVYLARVVVIVLLIFIGMVGLNQLDLTQKQTNYLGVVVNVLFVASLGWAAWTASKNRAAGQTKSTV
jgi:hypothetical protein